MRLMTDTDYEAMMLIAKQILEFAVEHFTPDSSQYKYAKSAVDEMNALHERIESDHTATIESDDISALLSLIDAKLPENREETVDSAGTDHNLCHKRALLPEEREIMMPKSLGDI